MKSEKRQIQQWGYVGTSTVTERKTPRSLRLLLVLLWLILMGGLSHSVMAQGADPCNLATSATDPNNPNEHAVRTTCLSTITMDHVTEGLDTIACTDDFSFNIYDYEVDTLVYSGSAPAIDIDLTTLIDKVIQVDIINDNDGFVSLSAFLVIRDSQGPTISCDGLDIAIDCVFDADTSRTGVASTMDNCITDLPLTFVDLTPMEGTCGDDFTYKFIRRWRTVDDKDRVATCDQTITINRALLSEVRFPGDVELSCENPIASPDSTGRPRLSGSTRRDSLLTSMSPCGLEITFVDDTLFYAGANYTIVRTWTVSSKCENNSRERIQYIEIKDTTDPIIVCPDDYTVGMQTGECTALLLLKQPTITDNCDTEPIFYVTTSFGGMGLGPYGDVRKGTHVLQYTAFDANGNMASCMTTLTVEDQESPVAACDDQLIISLTDGGVAIAKAQAFDEGSSDNCVSNLYYKVRRMDEGECDGLNGDDDDEEEGYQEYFDDFVFFCCADQAENDLRVLMRVYAKNPGRGAVHPDRMVDDGDLVGLFNECMALVTIQDKIGPKISCPPTDTVNCRERPGADDYGIFGSPIVDNSCGTFTLDSVEVFENEGCGLGTILRTFTATDNQGATASCSQTIILENTDVFIDTLITWPKDVDTLLCNGTLEPGDLEPGFDVPVIDFVGCSPIHVSHRDDPFETSEGIVNKIHRYWTVIDWCQFDRDGTGRYTHRQVIKLSDKTDPVISCPVSVIVEGINGGSCTTARVDMPVPTATDNCDPSVAIIHDSGFADNPNGADASGVYPLGETIVTFYAIDQFGNRDRCEVSITVEDDIPPSPLCIVGLSAPLTEVNDDQFFAFATAEMFSASELMDPCNPANEITLSLQRAVDNPTGPPTTTELTFSCDDIGPQFVQLWATDEAGNSGYCTTRIDIQDNNGLCSGGAMAQGMIAGQIQTEGGSNVENVLVSIQQENPFATMTDVAGGFMVNDIPFGTNVTLIPRKDDDLLNGVTTMDMILIQNQILGLRGIESPYSMIAADIDGSGGISTLDLIRLRKLILNKDKAFPNGNTSWRFIDADYQFPEGENPLKMDFPELKDVRDFRQALSNVRFVAVKVGDVNGSVRPNSVMMSQGRSTNGEVVLDIQDRNFVSGETFTVEVSSQDLFNLVGMQYTLDYNERLLELVEIQAGDLPRMTVENFALVNPEEGLITASWNEENDVVTMEEAVVARLTFRAIREGDLYTALELKSNPTLAEAYNYNQDAMQILLRFRDENGGTKFGSDFRVYQNYPNPFTNLTKIGFVLPSTQDVRLSVYDVAGKIILKQQGSFTKGYNELQLNSSDLPQHGLFFYTIETDEHTVTNRMIFTSSR